MTNESDSGQEALLAIIHHDRDDEPATDFKWVRELTEEESAESRRAWPLISAMTEESAFSDLTLATEDFHAQVEILDGAARKLRPEIRARLRRVQREFKSWLSAFRSFDDRTSTWLSREFGKEHGAYTGFKASLSHEFDHNFAYRLCSALRNASEHSGEVINDVELVSQLPKDIDRAALARGDRASLIDAQAINFTRLRINGPKLAEMHPKMRKATRDELAQMTRPVVVESVIGAAYLSCMRAHAELFLRLWPDLEAAAEVIERHHAEAVAEGGVLAHFATTESLDALLRTGAPLSLRYNSHDLAALARSTHAQCIKITTQMPAPRYAWSDLTEQT